MRKIWMSKNLITLGVVLGALITAPAIAGTADSIHILNISAQDQRAVVKQADGTMRIVKVGDAVGDYGTITEIAQGRVVLDKVSDKETEKTIIHLEKDGQRIERIKRGADKSPSLVAPGAAKNR